MSLARRPGPIVPFIAETGGQNALIVDFSALTEKVVTHVIYSGFNSAGQCCSVLRILCLQEDIADPVIRMLKGAMDELVLGDPCLLSTDIGPVIDQHALQMLIKYVDAMRNQAHVLHQVSVT
jgi:RHH-type proline utilization regulon transcriptional repressor/proline dehydrogenase/delta 1-pyrroline-5-carboxylate dehydrogenase